MFKKKKSIKLTYIKQGLIYFTCMDYKEQSQETQEKILNLCILVAGEDYKALFELLTNRYKDLESIAREHYISHIKLSEYRKEFYEKFESFR